MGFKELTKAPSAIAAGYLHEIASSFMEWHLFLYHRQVIVIVIKKITENICISFKYITILQRHVYVLRNANRYVVSPTPK